MWKISVKGMWAHKRRLLRTCSAVLLGVAFLAGTLVLGDTMRAGFSDVFAEAYASTDVVVEGVDTVGGDSEQQLRLVPEDVVDRVGQVAGVAAVVPTIEGLAQVTGSDGDAIGGSGPPTVGSSWATEDPMNGYRIAEGRAPRAHDEVVIDRGTADTGQLAVGDTATVRTPTPIRARIVGIVEFGTQPSMGGSGFTGFTYEDAREYLIGGSPGYTGISMTADDGVTAEELARGVRDVLPEGYSALTATQMQAAEQESIGDDFLNAFEMFLLVFTGVALLVATFSIYNTFSVILAQRSRESALFRAIGATRSQVLGSIGLEAVAVGLVASVGGLVVGLGLAVGLSSLMRSIGIDLPGGLEVTPNSIVVSMIVGLVVTLVASLAPAIRASRIAPLAALRDSAIDRSDFSPTRAALGAVLTAAGGALVLYGALGPAATPIVFVGYGAVLAVLGVVTLGPVVARPVSRLLGAPIAATRGASGTLARGNAMRNPRRTAGTASALMIGVAVVALFTVVGSSLSAMVRTAVVGSITADLLVVDSGFSGSGMSPDLATQIGRVPGVDHAVGLGFGPALVDGEEFDLTVADPSRLDSVIDSDVQQGSISDLGSGQVAVSTDAAEEFGWVLGTPLEVSFIDGGTESLPIGAIYAQSELTGPVVVPREVWAAHSTVDLDYIDLVALSPGADLDAVRDSISALTEEFGAPEPQTRNEYADEAAGQITQLLGIVYVLLALSIVIALMGIANTLALSIHERTRELGLLRAVGQTRGQLRSMVRWESVIIAVFGTIGGIGLGLFLAWGMVRSLAVSEGVATFSTPVGQLVAITLIGGLAGVLAAVRPAQRAGRLHVLDALSTE